MNQKIQNLFTKSKSFKSINFETLNPKELINEYPDALMDLTVGKKDGFLVKNFLSRNEIDSIKSGFAKIPISNLETHATIHTFPPSFAVVDNKIKDLSGSQLDIVLSEYFEISKNFVNNFEIDFGVDIVKKINDFFSAVSLNRKVKFLSDVQGHNFPFGVFRFLSPPQGQFNLHCGNEFNGMTESFYNRFNSVVAVKNQLSYFLVISKPDAGGELTVFNLKWNEKQVNGRDALNPNVKEYGSKIYFKTDKRLKPLKLNPQPGDMIVFQGGNLWHQVEAIEGKKPRLTLGGFLAFTYDQQEVVYWS